MKELNLKPTHKPIRDYYEALEQYDRLKIRHEGAVSNPFAFLLATCAKRAGGTLEPQHAMRSPIRCFPFYTYDEDGGNRLENITDWALKAFQNRYKDYGITKWDIFYYSYGILHHPCYRKKYQEDLKHSLPRFHFSDDFRRFSEAGKQLADLHINYESVPKYTGLTLKETPNIPLDLCVEKMKFHDNKTQIQYNDFLTIEGIPAEVHNYKLGDKSALEWIVDQYSVTEDYDDEEDRGSRIVNDPNREAEPQYIVDLIARVITVSLETVKIIKNLPALYSVDED